MNSHKRILFASSCLPGKDNDLIDRLMDQSGEMNVLRLIKNNDGLPRQQVQNNADPTGGWSQLIDGIHIVSKHAKEVVSQAEIQRNQLNSLIKQMRQEMEHYESRAYAAEKAAQDAEAAFRSQIMEVEARASAAEERALVAETWLKCVQETMFSEFNDLLG